MKVMLSNPLKISFTMCFVVISVRKRRIDARILKETASSNFKHSSVLSIYKKYIQITGITFVYFYVSCNNTQSI